MRIFRGALGALIIYQGVIDSHWLLILPGAWFLYQAIANKSCCANASYPTTVPNEPLEVSFEEVKTTK